MLDYLSGRGSQDDICKRYAIRSKAKLQIWIKKYNGHEELKASSTEGTDIMTKGRKTTSEERVEIAFYCIFIIIIMQKQQKNLKFLMVRTRKSS